MVQSQEEQLRKDRHPLFNHIVQSSHMVSGVSLHKMLARWPKLMLGSGAQHGVRKEVITTETRERGTKAGCRLVLESTEG